MKITRLFALVATIVCATVVLNAQQLVRKGTLNQPQFREDCVDDLPQMPENVSTDAPPVVLPIQFRADQEVIIGTTFYDLQANNSTGDRISSNAAGDVRAVWTMSQEMTGYSDRGTGYNGRDGGSWGPQPAVRLEAATRTGWPNHVWLEDGTEFVVAHSGTPRLHYTIKATDGTLTEGEIATTVPVGQLWPRAAGSGNNIHVLAISYPVANGGAIYEGVDGHPLYYRSTDGGQTWDKTDVILPGLDQTAITSGTADGYAIDANGDVVAVLFVESFSDVILMKSTDNGETWTKHIVHDFPLDLYQTDQGYTAADLPTYSEEEGQPDSLAILSNDETGSVVVDNNGMVHVFWGRMWVQDDDLTDGNSSYYPGTSGLYYWNETMGTGESTIIADVIDRNGNDTLDVNDIALYFASLTGQPSAGVDADNNLYVAYAGLVEGTDFENSEDGQNYRHIYLVASTDGGATWTDPYDAINEETLTDASLLNFIEGVFPGIPNRFTGNVPLIYQQDFRPGLIVRGDMDPAETNFIIYLELTPEDLGLVSTEEVVTPEFFNLDVRPNPASSEVMVKFDLESNSQYTLSLYNAIGQKVSDIETARGFANNQVTFNVDNLESGLYYMILRSDNKAASAKLMVK
ncbi:MAG TPA: T9SS type A sorting domain-containing protein [Saprospiraceae bacterium]|nr:T9SS type A sorting domain-containing protein [Saprospiraceae bacterium]HMQ81295.1 T9SS type A sorting domain-containing protein [Saprospiraceae bacterium]